MFVQNFRAQRGGGFFGATEMLRSTQFGEGAVEVAGQAGFIEAEEVEGFRGPVVRGSEMPGRSCGQFGIDAEDAGEILLK